MESILVGGVLGSGYLLSQYGKNSRKNIENENSFIQPSQNNIYDSNWYTKSKDIESNLVNNSFDKARNGINTNIIAPQFNNAIFNTQTNPISYLQNPELQNNQSSDVISPLTGLPLSKTNFAHNNMLPYFGSRVRQSNSENLNSSSILGNHTGIENFTNIKKEATPLFEPSKDLNIQYGTQNTTEDVKNRFQPSTFRQNELPFEQVRVGPSLNSGYSSKPSGGFHPDTREFILPKTIDELRPLSRPQISYKGRVVAGKSTVGKQTKIGSVELYRPDTFVEMDPERYLTTVGAVKKEMSRPDIIVRDTNRKFAKEYTGGAAPAVKKNNTSRSLYKKTTKTSFKTTGARNAFSKDSWKNEKFGDYGKQGIAPVQNERQVTGTRTHVSNLTSIVKALVAPVLDVMKTTRKENAEGNIRQTGNIGTTHITKGIVYDPNDVARTTTKETLIHDTHTGNINTTQGQGSTVLDKETMKFKTTIRETLRPEDYVLNMKSNSKNVVKDMINDKARTTTKETTIDDNHVGIMKGPVKLTVYDPNDIARTTIKETIIDDNHIGIASGLDKGMGYTVNEMEAVNTNRQFTGDFEYEGIAKTDQAGGGMGYLTNEHEAPNTIRQFTGDYEYEGTADSYYKKPTSNDAEYNMRHNASRELTLEGRAPTQNNVKVYNGKDTMNVKIDKIDGDYMNQREVAKTKVYNSTPEIKACTVTKTKTQYKDAQFMGERINPDLLNAFKQNPYTHSLSSFNY